MGEERGFFIKDQRGFGDSLGAGRRDGRCADRGSRFHHAGSRMRIAKNCSREWKKLLAPAGESPKLVSAQYARACGRVSVGGDLDKRPVNRPWKTGNRRRTGEPRPTGDAA
jgi:hypothetical protein